jgi:transcriptional regulator with XRE-family HTH domain
MRTDLKDAREAKGFTQREMADKIGKSQGVVSRYETGHYEFDAQTALVIAKVLGMDVLAVLYPKLNGKKKAA